MHCLLEVFTFKIFDQKYLSTPCTLCRVVRGEYCCCWCGWPLCTEECGDTENHRRECQFFQDRQARVRVTQFGVPNSLYEALLPLRVLLLKITNPRVYNLLGLLMDHQDQVSESRRRRYKRISDTIRHHWNFGKDFTHEEIVRVLGILSVNSFTIHDGVEDGTGLIGIFKSQQFNWQIVLKYFWS